MDQLPELAELLRQRNAIDAAIAATINRPALIGHMGEWIAERIFNIMPEPSASSKSYDGSFRDGPLAEKNVNIKWYPAFQGLLDITPAALPDYYLVMTGPRLAALSSKGRHFPLVISNVFLFQAGSLVGTLQDKVKIGIATSVRRPLWDSAEIFPRSNSPLLTLTEEQQAMLSLFSPE